MQSAELLRDREHVHESRLAALHSLIEAQCVQKLETRGRLVVREVQVVLQVVRRVRNVDL